MQIDLTQIILAVITLIFALISRYVIPYAKSKLNKDQMELLQTFVKAGVYAAEQLYNTNQGQEKKEYVISFLRDKGYILNTDQIEPEIDTLIEAMVRELKIEQAKNNE